MKAHQPEQFSQNGSISNTTITAEYPCSYCEIMKDNGKDVMAHHAFLLSLFFLFSIFSSALKVMSSNDQNNQ